MLKVLLSYKERAMALVRVKGKYQVTIPKEVRRKLGLRVGDYLEVEVQGSTILLKPKALLDKDEALEKLRALLEKLGKSGRLFRKKRWSGRFWRRSGRCGAKGRRVEGRPGHERSRRRLPPPGWGEWPGFGVGRGALRALPLQSHPR
jgi:AbrB family looped-hinge helix DNA binding protein